MQAPNAPPYENCWRVRHGPVEFFCADVYRYSDSTATDATAARFKLGTSQEAWLKAAILDSAATWKVVIFHNPTGGRNATTPSEEAYARGSATGISEKTEYHFHDLHAWMKANGVDVFTSGHDHVFSVNTGADGSLPCVSLSSPITTFGLTYALGYNATGAADQNDTENKHYDADIVSALARDDVASVVTYEATATQLVIRNVSVATEEVLDTYTLAKAGDATTITRSIGRSRVNRGDPRSRIGA